MVQRDHMPVTTPKGIDLVVPSPQMAEASSDEWRAQTTKIVPSTMPMTQMAMTALDITSSDRNRTIMELCAYADSELLCHHVDTPEVLAERQRLIWQPYLDWCSGFMGIRLEVGVGIIPIAPNAAVKPAIRIALGRYDNWRLTGLRYAVDVCGSLVLGLALTEAHATPEEIANAADLDALFQMEKWGEDPAILQRSENLRHDLNEAARWFRLLQKT